MTAVIVFIASVMVAPWVAWRITGKEGSEWWPIAAFALQLGLHVAWSGILFAHSGLSDQLLLPLASALGVLTIALISALLRLARRSPRREYVFGVVAPEPDRAPGREEVFGVLTPELVDPAEGPAPRLPRAQVVKRSGRRRHSAYRRSSRGDRTA